MNNIESLDIVFNFLPKKTLSHLKKIGLYDPILSGRVSSGAELYDCLSEEILAHQDADYIELANDMMPFMNKGSVLQVGCGRGGLLYNIASLGFCPVYGIDRSETMLKAAKQKLSNFGNIVLFNSRVETFNFKNLRKIDNIIINNFWGMIPENDSIKLLLNLKQILPKHGIIIIGDYEEEADKERTEALRVLKNNLNFTFSFTFFKNFDKLGYDYELVDLNSKKYFLLKLNDAIQKN